MGRLNGRIKKLLQFSLALLLIMWQVAFATTPFFKFQPAAAVPLCEVDTAGANDEPGQKDLTKLCVDYAGVPNTVQTTWNWDELGTSGANTLDACNLFDTDNDGNINYAVCVTTTGNPASLQTLTTYSCGDDKIDRCTSPATVIANGTTSCTVTSPSNTDPFPTGANSPNDTQGACTIQLAAVGGASATLVDVCSYPSAQPNSDPSDCVIARNDFGKVELIKQLDPETDPGLFNLSINGPEANDTTTVNNVGDGGTTGEQVVKKGSVVVSETAGTNTLLSNYTTTIVCRDLNGTGSLIASATPTGASSRQLTFTLVEDADVVCTITNTRQQATLILQKTVVNDNGGTLTQTNFPVFISGNAAQWGNNTVSPGTYLVSETTQNGYQASSWGGDCTANGGVTLTNGQTKTCTITNDDISPQLTVIKHVVNDNGGNADADDFTMNVTGTNVSDSSFPGAENPGTTVTLNAGNYSVSEDTFAGYTASYSADCSGSIALGETKTCTVTNDDNAPRLTLVKNVVNDNGGTLTAGNFVLHLSGGAYNGTQNFSTGATPGVNANTSYTLSEDTQPGYSQTNIGCTDDDTQQAIAHPVSLSEGQRVTCTITNDDIAPRLTVIKEVTNNSGGTLTVSSFPLFVDAVQVTSGQEYTTFNAGIYTVSETQQPGYSLTSITGDCLSNGSITLEVGGVYTCTLNNDDIPATIKVTKQVINDNGGTADVNDFTLKVNSTTVTSGVSNTFNGNTQYTISETALVDGYTQTSLTCVDVTNGGSQSVGSPFTAELDHDYECTIVNDDNAPKLTLIKNVVNDFGTAADANTWTLSATPEANSVNATTVSGDGNPADGNGVNDATVFAGVSYTLAESGGANGYTASSWVCNGGDLSGDELELALGDDVTCTITNRANAPQLIVIKNVINDNGGTQQADDFTINVSGTEVSDDSFSGQESPGTTVTLDEGAYEVTEIEQSGYVASYSTDCEGTIALGETKTCTITNDDIAPTLTLVKTVINDNGGDAAQSEWTLTALNFFTFETLSGNDQTADDTTGVSGSVSAGTYLLSESDGPAGYDLTSLECNDNEMVIPILVLAPGDDVTCVFTNDDQAPSLTVVKEVTNDSGGSAVASDFKLRVNNTELSGGTEFDQGAGITYSFPSAQSNTAYDVTEDSFVGYENTSFTCIDNDTQATVTNPVTLNEGQNVTCTFENDDIAPALTLAKANDKPNPTTVGDTVTYTLTVTVPEDSGVCYNTVVTDLPPENFEYVSGSWTASSNLNSGYSVSEPTYASPGQWSLGTLLPGETITLTYKAVIASFVSAGTYPDLAFARAFSAPSGGTIVLANVSTGSTTPFVGTEVAVVSEPQVLGVSTLADTGQNATFNFIAAFSLISLGLALLVPRQTKGAVK